MTDAKTRLAEIRARCEKATPGPWRVLPGDELCRENGNTDGISSLSYDHGDIVRTDCGVYPPNQADAAFIAAARSDVPWLLERIAHLEELVRFGAAMNACGSGCPFCGAYPNEDDRTILSHASGCPAFLPNGEIK